MGTPAQRRQKDTEAARVKKHGKSHVGYPRSASTDQRYPFLVARVERYGEPDVISKDIEARVITLKQKALEVLTQTRQAPEELVNAIRSVASPTY